LEKKKPIEITEEDLTKDANFFIIKKDEDDSALLCEVTDLHHEATNLHISIANTLYFYHLQRDSTLNFDNIDNESNVSM
jgi:hypothetical protein